MIDTRAQLTELVVRSGMKVLEAILEEDRVAVCGAGYAHQADREAGRGGTKASTVVLSGRKVQIRRPRVRAGKTEVRLPTLEVMAQTDPLNRRVVEQILLGVATRRYARSLEPLPTASGTATSSERSTGWCVVPGSLHGLPRVGRGSMISATASPCARCLRAYRSGEARRSACSGSRRIWAMSTPSTHIGICPRRRNCCSW